MSYCGKLIRGKKTSNVMINIRMNVRDSVWDIIISQTLSNCGFDH